MLSPPPQAVSVTARTAALNREVHRKGRVLFGMAIVLLRLKVSDVNIVAQYDGIKSVINKKHTVGQPCSLNNVKDLEKLLLSRTHLYFELVVVEIRSLAATVLIAI
jgi:hypothetical protein